ncbi:alpha/beta hydrolase [Novosphingobium sp. M1R2S20]|uniref:Alpha/beta hydrolase n=1 Tax=Novosphingobium rhizovicinum TaxID=3228928 RepID=A0ABV3REK4_9SPHN
MSKLSSAAKWGALAGAAFAATKVAGRSRALGQVAPELRRPGLLAGLPLNRWSIPAVRFAISRMAAKPAAGIRTTERYISGPSGAPNVRVALVEREGPPRERPVLLWVHGGGYVIGSPEIDADFHARILQDLDVLIVSVDYRLAPEHPYPAALDDCHAALSWLVRASDELRIDTARIAIGGQSAGGGLAAALVQRAVDEGPIKPAFQLLIYPMIDDRTVNKADHAGRGRFMWTPANNRMGWSAYLGKEPGGENVAVYAAPARREDLSGMPPAWIGVGTLDLFYPECTAYAARLRAAGVECDLDVVPGAYHGFELVGPESPLVSAFKSDAVAALGRGIGQNKA